MKATEYTTQQAATGRLAPWTIEVLLHERPSFDDVLLTDLRRAIGRVDAIRGDDDVLMGFGYPDVAFESFGRREVLVHMFTIDGIGDRSSLDLALEQTWDWDDARNEVARATSRLIFSDMMAYALEPTRRLEVFVEAVRAIAKHAKAVAIHWLPSQRVVEPDRFIAENGVDVKTAAVNVRMFKVAGRTSGEIVMDTLGMAAFGLPDLQCHYAGIEHNHVAQRLFEYAAYIFEHGDVIQDGHTVDGAIRGSVWSCRHEQALVAPERTVVDMASLTR